MYIIIYTIKPAPDMKAISIILIADIELIFKMK